MKPNDFQLFHRLRVRWAEVDMQKIVFNAHYLMYFDTAITDYWRALALPYEEAMTQLGGELYVKKASVEYHGSARFDDRLAVALKCERIGNSSMVFTGAIFRGDELLVTCELVYVFADPASQTSRPVPPGLRSLVERFEAGESILEIKIGEWTELQLDVASIRRAVFVQDQCSALEAEWDEYDGSALHAVAFNALGQGIASGRLVRQHNASGKISRLAVHRALRGGGIGRAILGALVIASQKRGDHEIMLHAPGRAEDFYLREGFMTRGEPFIEAGTLCMEMFKPI
ncbi:YbgC/FadM family acyl-CoA thioesterase [Polaromonas sp. CG_9.11]|uniref:YbgC/FadM family acyl-CoA thioesterase n=1 Tax=Polaromonas sp. CG_9.11 TaxID=2787730 RepID=UPI0018C9D3F7|nr:YbgC/FadM family acyl-CoA thioesterase [Polaromonas sp. CG_9.11]MBG6077930.1 YbgC/YbaW family acyl-CoA thioester hydrolase [Polaromonas sp. CG_9.11]